MADQKDQRPDPPAEDPTFLPLKKRTMAEKALPGSNRAPESESESDSESSDDEEMMDCFGEEFKKKKLEQLKRKAFYSVLHAFTAETSTISNKRTQIIERLMNELNISHETHISFEDNIQKNLLAQKQRGDSPASDEKEIQIVEAKPLTISEEKATSTPTSVPTSRSSWGSVNPMSLVGKRVRVKMPDEDHFDEFVIKEYDPKEEVHRIESTDSNAMEMDSMLTWMDVREVPPEAIMWEGGEKLNF